MSDVFEMITGPYIPPEHEGLGLLPMSQKEGGEVFSYPAELDAIDQLVAEHEGITDDKDRGMLLMPYGKKSYGEYFSLLRSYADKCRDDDPELASILEWLIAAVKRLNDKKSWSVVRYVGSQYDEDPHPDLTKGQCYYWPCSKDNPQYEGVIDNEEFTSYLYPCDSDSWEIVLDPTGMAERALAGDAYTVDRWKADILASEGLMG